MLHCFLIERNPNNENRLKARLQAYKWKYVFAPVRWCAYLGAECVMRGYYPYPHSRAHFVAWWLRMELCYVRYGNPPLQDLKVVRDPDGRGSAVDTQWVVANTLRQERQGCVHDVKVFKLDEVSSLDDVLEKMKKE